MTMTGMKHTEATKKLMHDSSPSKRAIVVVDAVTKEVRTFDSTRATGWPRSNVVFAAQGRRPKVHGHYVAYADEFTTVEELIQLRTAKKRLT